MNARIAPRPEISSRSISVVPPRKGDPIKLEGGVIAVILKNIEMGMAISKSSLANFEGLHGPYQIIYVDIDL